MSSEIGVFDTSRDPNMQKMIKGVLIKTDIINSCVYCLCVPDIVIQLWTCTTACPVTIYNHKSYVLPAKKKKYCFCYIFQHDNSDNTVIISLQAYLQGDHETFCTLGSHKMKTTTLCRYQEDHKVSKGLLYCEGCSVKLSQQLEETISLKSWQLRMQITIINSCNNNYASCSQADSEVVAFTHWWGTTLMLIVSIVQPLTTLQPLRIVAILLTFTDMLKM